MRTGWTVYLSVEFDRILGIANVVRLALSELLRGLIEQLDPAAPEFVEWHESGLSLVHPHRSWPVDVQRSAGQPCLGPWNPP